MKIAIVVLLCLSALPYLMACISGYYRQKQLGKIDNQNPRGQYAQLQGVGARAVAAQQNSWEALGFYSAALLAVVASGVVIEHLAQAAIIVLVARLFHAIFYLANIDKLRTLFFAIAIAPSFYLFYMAISHL
jgi:uncharacterized MAPEG superfamily protein